MIFSIIIFILTLLILVLIHEFGHFLMAKRFGIKVLEFGFGIPPKILGKKFGETEYSLNALPIGGFVRLLGEDEADQKMLESHRSFAYQHVYKRMVVVLAGVVMNFLLANLVFYIFLAGQNFKIILPYNNQYNFVGVNQKVESFVLIGEVAKGSPAQSVGIKVGERVVSLNGENIVSSNQLVEKTKALAGQEIEIKLLDQDKTDRLVRLTPRKNPPSGEGAIGIAFGSMDIATISYETPLQKLFSGPIHSYNLVAYSVVSLGDLIGKSWQQQSVGPISGAVAGPVGITNIANQILTSEKNSFIPYLGFIGLISLNLAVFNFLPIPALDGGRLFFLIIEAVTGKRVHPVFEKWVHTVGMAALLLLSLLITVSDIKKML